MKILLSVVVFSAVMIILAKFSRNRHAGWYVAVAVMTAIQVAVLVFLLFNMENPVTEAL